MSYTSDRLKVETIQIGIGSVMNIGGVRPYNSIGVTINKNNYFKDMPMCIAAVAVGESIIADRCQS